FIENNLDGKWAKTEILFATPLQTPNPSSLLKIKLHTGRTHQIRKHLAQFGFPIVGDRVYNPHGLSFKKGLMLVSIGMKFIHPTSGAPIEITYLKHKKFEKYVSTAGLEVQ